MSSSHFFKFYRALDEQSIYFPQFTGERVSFMRITCGLDLMKRKGCGLLRRSLGFSHSWTFSLF